MQYKLLLLISCILFSVNSQQNLDYDLIGQNGEEIEFLNRFLGIGQDLISQYVTTQNEKAYKTADSEPYDTFFLTCEICEQTVDSMTGESFLKTEVQENLIEQAGDICQNFSLPLYVCQGIAEEQIPIMIDALWDHYIDENYICPARKDCQPYYEVIDIEELIQEILSDKPDKEPLVPKMESTFKFLQLTDVHTDLNYKVGAKIYCDELYSCCREDQDMAEGEELGAQYWGSYGNCDLPTRTYDQMLQFIEDNIVDDIDFAIWTGDNTDHDVWEQSADENLANTENQTKKLQSQLPDLQVYPIFGNHETHPVNSYNYETMFSEVQFNTFLGNLWSEWLDDDAQTMLNSKGFYEQVIDEEKKLKIIALNSQSCYDFNFYLMRNPTDPDNMLQFLRGALERAEQDGYGVYLIYHIPPNSECYNTYSRVLAAIVDRYSYTIRGQFQGHTHADEIGIYYNQDNQPVNVNWIAPSLTSYGVRNPSFRVIEADSETLQIVNIHQYRLDLEYWNQFTDEGTQLEWDLAYDFVSEYNLENIYDLNNLDDLRERIRNDLETYNKYMFNKRSGVYESDGEIDLYPYCKMLVTKEKRDECMGKEYEPSIQEFLAGPWIKIIED